jgi:hypothetical protein
MLSSGDRGEMQTEAAKYLKLKQLTEVSQDRDLQDLKL